MISVIVNADDFGLHRGINQGIIKAHREGILSSATLMANMPGFEEAVILAHENSGLGIGVHLNVVRGFPLSPPERIPNLLRSDGTFFGDVLMLRRRLRRRPELVREIEREWRSQIEKVLAADISVSHLDSEKHSHILGPLLPLAAKLAGEYGFGRIRFINELGVTVHPVQSFKTCYATLSCLRMKKRLREEGILTTDRFIGIAASGRITASAMRRILNRLRDGVTEIMVHPGFILPEMLELEKQIGSYYINKYREQELAALLDGDLKKILSERKIRLINYHQLVKT